MITTTTHSHNGIAWTETGDPSARPVLFVGGYGCNKEVWRHQLPRFAKSYRVIAMDMPGHGASEPRASRCSIEGYGGVVNEVREHLGLEGALIVGHSMGGRVALEAQRHAPEAYRGVVLLDVSRAVSPDHDDAARKRLSTGEDHKAFRAHMRTMFEENFSPSCEPWIKDEIRASSKALDHACATALTPTIGKWDHDHWQEALTQLRAPLYVLQSTYLIYGKSRKILEVGEETPFFEMVREHVPEVQIDWLKSGHFSMLEEPDAVSALLLRFAQSLD